MTTYGSPASKLIRLLPLALAALPLHAQLPPVETRETPTTFVVRGDFNGDGRADAALVDKISGNFHTLLQTAGGTFDRTGPFASGVAPVAGAASGRVVTNTRDHLIVSGIETNRLAVVDAASAAIVPVPLHISSGVGPGPVATGDQNGSFANFDDLVIGTTLNANPNPTVVGIHRVTAPASATFNQTLLQGSFAPAQATRVVIKNTVPHSVGWLTRAAASSLRVSLLQEAGSPVRLTVTGVASGADWAAAPLNGEALATVFTWVPGSTTLRITRLQELVANNFSELSSANVPMGDAVASVTLVPASATDNRVLITFGDGSLVRVYSFVAPSTLNLQQTLSLPAGESAFGAIGLPGFNGFQLLTGSTASGRIQSSRVHRWNGASFQQTQVISGLEFNPLAARTNVFLYTADPFVNQGASLVARFTARDWTSGAAPTPPGTVSVVGESFGGGTQGLGSGAVINFGAFPAGANYTLLSQYRGNISIFGASRPGGAFQGQVGITPEPGTYDRSVLIDFEAPAGYTVRYRLRSGVAWQVYNDPGLQPSSQSDPAYATWLSAALPLMLFRDTTVEFYGESGSIRTPIRTARFQFSVPPDRLSSLNDGVPDYVKIGLGYNPFLQPPEADSPGDTTEGDDPQSYLQKILSDAGFSIPNRNTTPGAYTLIARPLSTNAAGNTQRGSLRVGQPLLFGILPDGTTNPGNTLTAHALSGGPLDSAPVGANALFTQNAARLEKLTADPDTRLFVVATSPNFAIDATFPAPPISSRIGRELFGLVRAPQVPDSSYSRTYTGGTNLAEANAWLTGASTHYAATVPIDVGTTIDTVGVGSGLVFENWLQRRLVARGVLPSNYDPAAPGYPGTDRITLTAYRATEPAAPLPESAPFGGLRAVSSAVVNSVATYLNGVEPGHRPDEALTAIDSALRTSLDPDIAAFRSLVIELFRISAAYGNQFPGGLEPPLDALRSFVLSRVVPEPYTRDNPALVAEWAIDPLVFTSLDASAYASASVGVDKLLALPVARPFADFELVVRPDTAAGGCAIFDRYLLGGTYALYGADGQPFGLPDNFDLVPGIRIQVRAYTDVAYATCTGTPLEVIELEGVPLASVTVIPIPSAVDTDGNLLGDEWELAFFGALGNSPFSISGGDGYTLVQKYLDEKDPLVPASYTEFPPAALGIPVVTTEAAGIGQLNLRMPWPSAYFAPFKFTVQRSTNLADPLAWSTVVTSFVPAGTNSYTATVPYAGGPAFWRVLISLK